MSLRPQPFPPAPEDAGRVAWAAVWRGGASLRSGDRLGAVFADVAIADLHSRQGRPVCAPWRRAPVALMPFRKGLGDRQAVEIARGRIDRSPSNSADGGFDLSALGELRSGPREHAAAERLPNRLLDAAREGGLPKAGGRGRELQHPPARRRIRARPPGALGRAVRAQRCELHCRCTSRPIARRRATQLAQWRSPARRPGWRGVDRGRAGAAGGQRSAPRLGAHFEPVPPGSEDEPMGGGATRDGRRREVCCAKLRLRRRSSARRRDGDVRPRLRETVGPDDRRTGGRAR